jgi:TonB family protein
LSSFPSRNGQSASFGIVESKGSLPAMKTYALLFLVAVTCLSIRLVAQSPPGAFIPPGLTAATKIPYPANTTTTGAVTLLLSLDTSGQIQSVQVLRDLPPFTTIAQSSINAWVFKPAYFNGNPTASTLSTTVVFSPFNPGQTQLAPLSVLLLPASPVGAPQYVPPRITSASYPLYPPNTLSTGTVVLEVMIGKDGQVSNVRAVRSVPHLTQSAIHAVKSWSYSPATVNGNPAASSMAVAFVFQRNLS